MTVTTVAVAARKFLFAPCDCTVDGDVGTGSFFPRAGDFACVDIRMCDRTCLRAWAVVSCFNHD